jgi:hypothetical protein
MISRWLDQQVRRILSSLLLASGIVLVFAGLSAALGSGVPGMLASIAAITALLYAGGVWFGGAPLVRRPAGAGMVIVFDRELKVAAGFAMGEPVVSQFPDAVRPEIEKRCRAALRGESAQFTCEHGGKRTVFDASPVHTMTGVILYGVLTTGAGHPARSVAPTPVATVA